MTITMLVVDDEEADVIRFKRAARKLGVQRPIEICRGGAEVLQLLAVEAAQTPSKSDYLLVSDLKMPAMTGTELVAHLRVELGLLDLPAFILSSSDAAPDVEGAISSGANGYFLKCESEPDYLGIVRWLEDCCCRIELGHSLEQTVAWSGGTPTQLIAGPVVYRAYN